MHAPLKNEKAVMGIPNQLTWNAAGIPGFFVLRVTIAGEESVF
jgi:hypothetical protein